MFNKFLDYANRNWFDETSNHIVPQREWNVAIVDEYRTNNICEGAHHKCLIDYGENSKLLDWIDTTKKTRFWSMDRQKIVSDRDTSKF